MDDPNHTIQSSPLVVRGCAGSAYCGTDPTPEICATVVNDADYAGPTRQHELDHTDHTDHTR